MKISLRIWILIIALILSLLAIGLSFQSGVIIKSVDANSELFNEGMRAGEVIQSVNGKIIKTQEDYSQSIAEIFKNGEEVKISLATDKGEYTILTNKTPEITIAKIPRTKLKTGLDLQGGARALVAADEKLNEIQLEDLVTISRNRFNVYGVSDVNIRGVSDLEGNKFMLIEVAGSTPDDLENLIL